MAALATSPQQDAAGAVARWMGILEFGEALIETRDLDPVYCAIWGAKLPKDQLCRLLLAYLCFYHLGSAAWLSEHYGAGFWYAMDVAARNEDVSPLGGRWPRSAERRHFRGAKCVEAVRLFSNESPEHWIMDWASAPPDKLTDKSRMAEIQTWPMMGPWAAFKATDLLERVMGVPVRFDPNIGLMYEEPRKGLELWAETCGAGAAFTVQDHYRELLGHFAAFKAPPANDRSCGPQETETVLCKRKSHMNGHYPVGKDIHEVRHALAGWGNTADRLLRACPAEVA